MSFKLPEKNTVEEVRPFGIASFQEVSKLAEIISKNNKNLNGKEEERMEKNIDVKDAKRHDNAIVNKISEDGKDNINTNKEKNVSDVSEDQKHNLEKEEIKNEIELNEKSN